LPVLITDTAREQYLGMVGRYLQAAPHRPARPDAARRLIETYDAALARIAADPRSWLTHPRPYPELARYGFRWIKLHRSWFAWLSGPPPVITNILDEAGDIPRWVSDDSAPVDVA
jgi:plasmid stabilization system protein ParE